MWVSIGWLNHNNNMQENQQVKKLKRQLKSGNANTCFYMALVRMDVDTLWKKGLLH